MLCRHALRAGLRRGPALRLRVPQLGARRPVAAPTRVLAAAVNTGTSWRDHPNLDGQRHVLAALVDNQAGVLARVATLLAGRGYNIDSLVVGRTEVPELSRMTIVVRGETEQVKQIQKQLQDIVEVLYVALATPEKVVVERDLMLIKVATDTRADRASLLQLGDVFGSTVVNLEEKGVMFEISAHPSVLERFIEICAPYGIVEIARTGVVGMAREQAAMSNLIEDGALVERRLLERMELDAKYLPPG